MKKLLGIVVLGLLLSENSYANVTYVKCVSFELISYKRTGEVIKESVNDFEDLFEIDDKKKIISKYMEFGDYFHKLPNIKWSNSNIKWYGNVGEGNLKVSNDINRITGKFIADTEMKEIVDSVFKRQIVKSNCDTVNKKF